MCYFPLMFLWCFYSGLHMRDRVSMSDVDLWYWWPPCDKKKLVGWGHFIKYSKYVCPALGLKVSTAMSVYLWKRALSSKCDTLDFSRPGKTIKNITQDRKTKNIIFLKVCKTALLSWIGHQKFLDSVYKSLMINILEPFLCLRNLSLFYIMYKNDQIVPLWTFLFFYSAQNVFLMGEKFSFFCSSPPA